MYSTCIFCHSPLGRNEAIEHLQIGRRLAYDADKGRLWVVCRKCQRWNLTPFETRWEAIEEAERAFRASRLRVATDNIGMAQLAEGLELVRIGAPPKLEFAGWRYGDQFGKRRRKYIATTAAVAVACTAFAASEVAGLVILGTGFTGNVALQGLSWWNHWRTNNVIRTCIRDDAGETLHLTRQDMSGAALARVTEVDGWCLTLTHRQPRDSRIVGTYVRADSARKTILHHAAAQRALASILPYINNAGARASRLRDAIREIEKSRDASHLLHRAATNRQYTNAVPGENLVGGLPQSMRLALEMVLHEDDERRALDGELKDLEERWREADEIAQIADSLFLPSGLDERIDAIRRDHPPASAAQQRHQRGVGD